MYERLFLLFSILYLRYIIIAGLAFFVFYIILKRKVRHKKIQLPYPKLTDYQREISYSTLTIILFAVVGFLVFSPNFLRPYTQIYDDISDKGWGYLILSFFLMLFTHDTYFYFFHRLMHTEWGMKYIHLVHHKSINPSPWAAFSFHPLEAVIETGIIFVFAFLFPVHQYAVMFFMIFMTFYNVYGHLGWELYPKNFHKSWVGKWINTSVNHNLHHKKFDGNYGLYFLIWDRLLGTIRADYDPTYEEVAARTPNS